MKWLKIPLSLERGIFLLQYDKECNIIYKKYNGDIGENNMKYKCEMGRSMIEVLGVISIVGILSIGGIMAYSYGMDKYVANETAKGLIARAIDVQTQIDTCGEEDCAISLDIWKKLANLLLNCNVEMLDLSLISFSDTPSSIAFLIILSSISVKLETYFTLYPKYLKNLTTESKKITGRELPMWIEL